MLTPREAIFRDGTAQLLRFRDPTSGEPGSGPAVLLVPSLINKWYVLDLREGASLVSALVRGGLDTYVLDWGVAEDEDRYLSWEDVLARLRRATRQVQKRASGRPVGMLGYCMGATLGGIHAALHHEGLGAFVNLLGPFDFAHAGVLGTMVDAKWFDAEAVAAAGNVTPLQMQSGFVALRPTGSVAKWVTLLDRALDASSREAFFALEGWANDNVPFPAAAYATYIRELYQENRLVKGEHRVFGRRVDLGAIACPVLTVAAEKDVICPPLAARGLHDRVGAEGKELLVVPGGHVGAVVGSRAPKVLYPAITAWLKGRLCSSIN